MASLHYLLQQLYPYFIQSTLAEYPDSSPDRIELLCGQSALRADRLYLGDLRALTFPEDVSAQPGTVLLLSNAESGAQLPPLPAGAAALLFACPLAKLHNALSAEIACAVGWQGQFQALADQGGGLHAFLAHAAELSGGAVVLLDQLGSLMASAGLETGSYLSNQLATTGTLPQGTLENMFPPSVPNKLYGSFAVPGTDLVLHGRRSIHNGEVVGILLMEERKKASELDIRTLCRCTSEFLSRRLFSNDPRRIGSTAKSFQQCWQDIMDRKLVSALDIRNALHEMPFPVERFVHIAVVSFDIDAASVPYNYLLTRLREFFPSSNMAFYQKDIVILLSYHERTFRPGLDEDRLRRLSELLARYNGALMYGNGTRNLESLSSVYLLAKSTLNLTRKLSRVREDNRIFYYEDFSVYTVIDLAVQRYLEGENNEDIIYLCHPAIVLLTRYDRENGTNLRDVLYYYLLNDRNLVKTAALTYMHRNTVINKINKATALIQLDLDDANLRQRLIFSCQLIKYYELVMQREVR